jgi:NADH-quinone oxidoreductase subunit N
MSTAPISHADIALILPEIWVLSSACLILLVDVFLSDRTRWLSFAMALATLAGAAYLTTLGMANERLLAFDGLFVADPMSSILKLFAYGTVAVAFLYSREYLQRRGLFKGEYYLLGLFALLGIMVIISAASLLTIYLGVELLALSAYALVAFDRDSGIAAEAAMKYFVLSSIASGTMLYGISIVYGVTGSLRFDDVAVAVNAAGASHIGLIFGLTFIVAGIAFKFGGVPFHMWIPDVYHGAPTPVTLFIGSVPKLAYFALAIRMLAEGLGAMVDSWSGMIIIISVLSMAVGNIVAIAQTNLKRMLAYSTISNVGFILLGILSGTARGYQASMFYTFAYIIMAIGSFGMILLLSRSGFEADRLEDFRGLNKRSPWFALMMMVLMFSTVGVPPFVGFWAKLEVITAVLDVNLTWLAGVAVFFSVIGAFYYLRLVWFMYFEEPTDTTPIEAGATIRTVLSANAIAALVLGIFPGALLQLCVRALS